MSEQNQAGAEAEPKDDQAQAGEAQGEAQQDTSEHEEPESDAAREKDPEESDAGQTNATGAEAKPAVDQNANDPNAPLKAQQDQQGKNSTRQARADGFVPVSEAHNGLVRRMENAIEHFEHVVAHDFKDASTIMVKSARKYIALAIQNMREIGVMPPSPPPG